MSAPGEARMDAPVDLRRLADEAGRRIPWSHQSSDLNVNLVALGPGERVEEHVNETVDVLLLGITGAGTVVVDGARHEVGPGQALVIPKGARRATAAGEGAFAYLTCHPRRGPLLPVRPGRAH